MKYQKGYKYQVYEDCFIYVPWLLGYIEHPYINLSSGYLTAKKGYAWDGASGPTFDTKTTFRGSLFHDILYQLMREKLLNRDYRKQADQLLYKLCREDGMNWFRAKYFKLGVCYFASDAAKPKNKRKIHNTSPKG